MILNNMTNPTLQAEQVKELAKELPMLMVDLMTKTFFSQTPCEALAEMADFDVSIGVVLKEQRTAVETLNELAEWAVKSGNQQVIEKIHEISHEKIVREMGE